SIRVFDPDTQRSQERLSSAWIAPFAAAASSEESRSQLAERLGRLPSEVERQVFAPAVVPMPFGWLDHVASAGALLAGPEPEAVAEELSAFSDRLDSDRDPQRDPFLPEELTLPAEKRTERLEDAPLLFDRLGLAAGAVLRLPSETIAGHSGRTAEAASEMSRAIAAGAEVFVAIAPTGGAEKLKTFPPEYALPLSSRRADGAAVRRP